MREYIEGIFSFCGGMLIGGTYSQIYEPFSLYWTLHVIPLVVLWALFVTWIVRKFST